VSSVRGPDGRFPPGVSGNPGGRPLIPEEVKAFLREQTLPNLQALVAMRDLDQASNRDRIAAVKCMLEFTLPKPKDDDAGLSAREALEVIATALKG